MGLTSRVPPAPSPPPPPRPACVQGTNFGRFWHNQRKHTPNNLLYQPPLLCCVLHVVFCMLCVVLCRVVLCAIDSPPDWPTMDSFALLSFGYYAFFAASSLIGAPACNPPPWGWGGEFLRGSIPPCIPPTSHPRVPPHAKVTPDGMNHM